MPNNKIEMNKLKTEKLVPFEDKEFLNELNWAKLENRINSRMNFNAQNLITRNQSRTREEIDDYFEGEYEGKKQVSWINSITNKPWVDVRAYGAKGDGATDDTVAIQAAFTALGDGDTLIFPNTGNDYVCESSITCSANDITVIGAGTKLGSRINFKSMGNKNGLTFTGSKIHLEDISIYSGDSSTQNGLVFDMAGTGTSHSHTLINVQSYNHGNNGIDISRPQTTVLIRCLSRDNGNDGFHFRKNETGGGTTLTLVNCWASANTRYGLYSDSALHLAMLGGSVELSGDFAIKLVNSDHAWFGAGLDLEGMANGGFDIDSTNKNIALDDIALSGLATGETGIKVNGAKTVSIDNVSFGANHADSYHIDFVSDPIDCVVGNIWNADSNTRALNYKNITGTINFPIFPLLSWTGMENVGASSNTTPFKFPIPITDKYYPHVESVSIYSDGGADCFVKVVDSQTAAERASLAAGSNDVKFEKTLTTTTATADDRTYNVKLQNDDGGAAHDIYATVSIRLIPRT